MTAVTPIHRTRSTISTVPLDDIIIDLDVQRQEGTDQRRVDQMAANFDPDALGLFILSQRADGTLACLDGMHRRAAALAAGHKQFVDARIFTGLSKAEEAALFLLYNNKKDPSAISRFKARTIKGDRVAVAIDRIVHEYGWKISTLKNDPGVLAAVEAAERVYRTGAKALPDGDYPEVLARTLNLITAAWGHDPVGTHGAVLEGIGQLYARFGDAVDTPKLIRDLQGTTPRPLIGEAKTLRDLQGGTIAAALAKRLTGIHNSRKRSNLLPEWVWVR